MDRNTIEQKLRQVIEPYVPDKSKMAEIKPETDLIADLQINSADVVDIILDAEEAFDIEIDDDSAEEMTTVQASIEVIGRCLDAQS